jgi:16S rRNA (guanine527-N7)-methyltransferase
MMSRTEITAAQKAKLEQLLDTVWEIQKVKRVVGFKRREDMWNGLVVPAVGLLRAVEIKPGWQVVDVGSGAGFPGMVLAILREDLRLTLLDAASRRCTIMEEVKRQLGLDVTVECGRAEDEQWAGRFDAAVAMWLGELAWAISVMRKMVRMNGIVAIITGLGDRSGKLPAGYEQKALDEHHTVIYGIVSRET